MASEQVMSEAITRAVAEATRVVLQTMAEAQVQGNMECSRTQTRQSHPKTAFIQLGSTR